MINLGMQNRDKLKERVLPLQREKSPQNVQSAPQKNTQRTILSFCHCYIDKYFVSLLSYVDCYNETKFHMA